MNRSLALACGLFASSLAGAARAENPVVVVDTNKGAITIELLSDKAPISVENFLKYVDSGHYNNTIFHRVIGPNPRQPQGFMIQGGGFENGPTPKEKETGEGIKNEAGNGLKNSRGTVAMARTPNPDSATAQFFVNLGDNGFLNRESSPDGFGYAVFGQVTEGMETVDAIAKVDTGQAKMVTKDRGGKLAPQDFEDVPTSPVVIKSIKRKPKG